MADASNITRLLSQYRQYQQPVAPVATAPKLAGGGGFLDKIKKFLSNKWVWIALLIVGLGFGGFQLYKYLTAKKVTDNVPDPATHHSTQVNAQVTPQTVEPTNVQPAAVSTPVSTTAAPAQPKPQSANQPTNQPTNPPTNQQPAAANNGQFGVPVNSLPSRYEQ